MIGIGQQSSVRHYKPFKVDASAGTMTQTHCQKQYQKGQRRWQQTKNLKTVWPKPTITFRFVMLPLLFSFFCPAKQTISVVCLYIAHTIVRLTIHHLYLHPGGSLFAVTHTNWQVANTFHYSNVSKWQQTVRLMRLEFYKFSPRNKQQPTRETKKKKKERLNHYPIEFYCVLCMPELNGVYISSNPISMRDVKSVWYHSIVHTQRKTNEMHIWYLWIVPTFDTLDPITKTFRWKCLVPSKSHAHTVFVKFTGGRPNAGSHTHLLIEIIEFEILKYFWKLVQFMIPFHYDFLLMITDGKVYVFIWY